MTRKIRRQGKKRKILVLCDGESEIVYSKLTVSTHKVSKNLVTIISKPFKNLESILTDLKNRKPKKRTIKLPYEEIHIVCDQEKLSNKSRQASYKKLESEINKMRKDFGSTTLKIITSFPTFEFFLLLHFPLEDQEYRKLHDDKELINLLSKQHKNYSKGDNKWLKDAIFNKNYEQNIKLAIERATKIKPSTNNSWSKVSETIKQIIDNSN